MKLYLTIKQKEIDVQCKIDVSKDSMSFALADSLKVSRVKNNNINVSLFKEEECTLQFSPAMKRYSFENLQKGTLSFEYKGSLDGCFLFMQENIKHFSFYNGWYPVGFDVANNYDVTVECDDSYELVNGKYDNHTGCYEYTAKDQGISDCNIMLINKAKSYCFKNDAVNLYYFDKQYEKYMQQFFDQYSSIYKSYVSFYGDDKIGCTSIVFLPDKYHMGAYKREKLIVFSEINDDITENLHRLAHEMAHSYAQGADTGSWEDWLNETHAEWTALLYELKYNPPYFSHLIQVREEEFNDEYLLRPNGNERPDNVHEAGTLIYYEIYKQYGRESIKTLLRTFDQLKVKNTGNFINSLKRKNKVLADEIKGRI